MARRLLPPFVALVGCAGTSSDDRTPGSNAGSGTDPLASEGSSGVTMLDGSEGDPDRSESSTGAAVDPSPWLCPTEPDVLPGFELGWDYKDGWIDLEPDGPLVIIIGGQGAWMIPLGVRGDGFCVPADSSDYENVPPLDVTIEAGGRAEPVAIVRDFPVSFEPIDEGGLGYTFIPMVIADGLTVETLEGLDTTIRAELRARDVPPLEYVFHGVLTISD